MFLAFGCTTDETNAMPGKTDVRFVTTGSTSDNVRCKIVGLKMQWCKILDKYHVWGRYLGNQFCCFLNSVCCEQISRVCRDATCKKSHALLLLFLAFGCTFDNGDIWQTNPAVCRFLFAANKQPVFAETSKCKKVHGEQFYNK